LQLSTDLLTGLAIEYRFAASITVRDVDEAHRSGMPEKTQRQTTCASKVLAVSVTELRSLLAIAMGATGSACQKDGFHLSMPCPHDLQRVLDLPKELLCVHSVSAWYKPITQTLNNQTLNTELTVVIC